MITEFKEHLLFPTPVYQNNIAVDEEGFNDIIGYEYEEMPSKNGHYTTNKKILDIIPRLKEKIQEHINCYVYQHIKISTEYNFHILNSWVNRHDIGDEASTHIHSNSLISGVYYLKTPKDSGRPVFHKPSGTNNLLTDLFDFRLTEANIINKSRYTIDIKEGDLLLFPSHLQHSVEKSQTNEWRYSLAFNVWVSGTFGDPDTIDELII